MRCTLAVVVVVLAACGPTVPVDDGGGDSGFDDAGGAETTRGGESTSGGSGPVTSGTTSSTATTFDSGEVDDDIDDGDPDDDDAMDDNNFLFPGDIICFAGCGPECDPFAQDCPEDQKCMPWANDGGDVWTAVRCVPLQRDPVGVGEACVVEGNATTGSDDCELGTMCWAADPITLEGTCVAQCGGTEASPTCADGLVCVIGFNDSVNVCVSACDPLAPACAMDEVCTHAPDVDPWESVFACLPTPPFAPQPFGAPCDGIAVCDAGLACAGWELVPGCEESCCTTLGDAAAPPACPDVEQTCIPFDEVAPFEGLCICGVES
jgi:hypothetical protein